MNIFITNLSPYLASLDLDDKRLVKMILETAQLLSTAVHQNSPIKYTDIYKSTHIKHPCTIWASANQGNYKWLIIYFQHLLNEYTYRYNKKHKSSNLLSTLKQAITHLPNGKRTAFANCTRNSIVDFRNIKYIVFAYRQYMIFKWKNDKRTPMWTKRTPPKWSEQ